MKKKLAAISLLETLVVIAILLLLATLVSPALMKAKHHSKVFASKMRLKQLHQIVEVYKIGNNDEPPSWLAYYREWLNQPKELFVSPCGLKPGAEGELQTFSYQYWVKPIVLPKYFAKYQEQAMLFSGLHCNPPYAVYSHHTTKLGLGITVSGRLVTIRKKGDATLYQWWYPED